MQELTKKDVIYLEEMTKDIIKSLKIILKYYENNNDRYLYNSAERARFKRLRVELGKKLMEIQKIIY
jgi:hypothetical protein